MACCVGEKYCNWCREHEIVWIDPETEKEFCILHAPAEHNPLGYYDLLKYIIKHVKKQPLDSTVLLRDIEFHAVIYFENIQFPSIDFTGCTFHRPITGKNIYFNKSLNISSCTFHDMVGVSNLSTSEIKCCNTIFKEVLTLYDTRVDQSIYSDSLSIQRTAHLSFNTTPRSLHLRKLEGDRVVFKKEQSSASDNTHFESTFISSRSPSSTPTVQFENLSFDKMHLPISCDCNAEFKNCTFNSFSANNILLHSYTLDECLFQKIKLRSPALSNLEILGCTFPKYRHRNTTSNAVEAISSTNIKVIPYSYITFVELFRKLKKQAQENQAQKNASDWHYWEKFYFEKHIFIEGTATEWSLLRLYRLLSDYGESVEKASGWLLVFILTPLLFAYISQLPSTHIDLMKVAKQGLDYIPLATRAPVEGSWSRFFQIFWQILITFQATLLGFALRNRYRR